MKKNRNGKKKKQYSHNLSSFSGVSNKQHPSRTPAYFRSVLLMTTDEEAPSSATMIQMRGLEPLCSRRGFSKPPLKHEVGCSHPTTTTTRRRRELHACRRSAANSGVPVAAVLVRSGARRLRGRQQRGECFLPLHATDA